MKVQEGQKKLIKSKLPDVNISKCSIVAEGGNDNGKTFYGSFMVKVSIGAGDEYYRFDDGEVKKIQ